MCSGIVMYDAVAVQDCGPTWYSTEGQMVAINWASKTNFQ